MAEDEIKRLPPHNVEAEASVIGALLIDEDAALKVLEIVQPADFYMPEHVEIMKAIYDLAMSNRPIDIVSVTDALRSTGKLDAVGGATYIAQLAASVPNAANVEYYAKIVRTKSLLRELIKVGAEISELGFNESADVDEVLDLVEQKIFNIAERKSKTFFIEVKEILPAHFEEIERRYKQKIGISGLASGYPSLDKITSGFQKSDLIIVAARPSIGKTSFALNIAENIATKENKAVGFFSLEMSKEQLLERMLSSFAKVDVQRLKTGYLREDDWSKLTEAYSLLYEAPIYFDDSPDVTLTEIRTKSRRLAIEAHTEIIFVDYLQLIRSEQRIENRVLEISQITRGLKNLARELNIPVVVLSQLSRAIEKREDKKPMLSDLRESGCLTGDTVLIRADTGELVPIKELVDNKDKLPIPVLSLNKDLKVESAKLTKAFSSGIKTTFLLKTQSGREIKASGNHPFLTLDGWKRLDELKIGDHIAVPREIKVEGKELYSDDEIIFFAHMIGDGCYVQHQPIHYTSSDLENIKIVEETSIKLFNISPRLVKQENWYHLYLPSPYPLTHNRHHPFITWLKNNGLDFARSYEKKLPNNFLRMTERQIKVLLKHLWATDGNISLEKNKQFKNILSIFYSSNSKSLIEQIQYLLLRIGIISTIRSTKKQNYRTTYILVIQGKEAQLKFLREVGCYGERGKNIPELIKLLEDVKGNPNNDVIPKEVWNYVKEDKEKEGISWRGLSKVVGVSYSGSSIFKNNVGRERLQKYANVLESDKLNSLAESDIYWDKIAVIKKLGNEEVFDVTIEGTHNFIANNIFVHNSIEQDADVVIFLHVPDEENREEIEAIVAKQRNGPQGSFKLLFQSEFTKFVEKLEEY